jgi:lipoprotein-anchoring transpeptidase ErfK/SrfK
MLQNVLGLVLGGVLLVALPACVPSDPSLTGATKTPQATVKQPSASDFQNAYVARQDGSFVVPAVPEEQVPPQLRRQLVKFETDDPVGTIIINPSAKTLHLVTAPGKAMRYGIAVGKDGFQWAGEALITDRKHWPTWTPPKEMIARKPELAKWEKGQPGGPTNPLGARALYLTTNGRDYGFRIHGTPEWQSIGRNASSGCFRMINQDVMDLYDRVPNGVKVVVLNADGSRPTRLILPPPTPVKKAVAKSTPKPVSTGAPAPGFPVMTAPITAPPAIGTPAALGTPPALTPAVPQPAAPAPAAATPAAPSATPVPAPAAPAVAPPAAAPAPAAACVPSAGQPCL